MFCLNRIILIFSILGFPLGDNYFLTDDQVYHLMETTMQIARKEMKVVGLDYFSIPDISFQHEDRSLNAHEGVLVGLEEFKSRTSLSAKGTLSTFNTIVSWSSLLADFKVKLDIMGTRNKTGRMQVDIADANVTMAMTYDKATQLVTMKEYNVILRGVRVTNTGLGPVELKAGKDLFTETTRRVQEPIKYTFNTAVKRMFFSSMEKAKSVKTTKKPVKTGK